MRHIHWNGWQFEVALRQRISAGYVGEIVVQGYVVRVVQGASARGVLRRMFEEVRTLSAQRGVLAICECIEA